MASKKIETFIVQPRNGTVADVTAKTLLLRGTRQQVESYVIGMHSIEIASPEQLLDCGKSDVRITDASAAG